MIKPGNTVSTHAFAGVTHHRVVPQHTPQAVEVTIALS